MAVQTRESRIVFSAQDKASSVISGLGRTLGNLDKRMGGLGRGLEAFSNIAMMDFAGRLNSLTSGLMQPAQDFERAMVDVTKTFDEEGYKKLNTTADGLESLVKKISNDMKVSGLSIAQTMAGLTTAKSMKDLEEITRLGMMMGQSFDLDPTQTKDALGSIFKQMDQNVEKTKEYSDTLNYLSNTTKSSVTNLLEFGNRSLGVASAVGMATNDMLAFGNTFDLLGTAPDMAFTAYKNMTNAFAKALTPSKALKTALDGVGLSGENLAKSFSKEQTGTIIFFLETLKKIEDPVKRTNLGRLFFGDESYGTISKLIPKLETFKNTLKISNDEQKKAGSLAKEYSEVTNTLAFRQQQATEKFTDLKNVIGTQLVPSFTKFYEKITDIETKLISWSEKNPELIKTLGQVTIGVLSVGAGLAGLSASMGIFSFIFSPLSKFVSGLGLAGRAFGVLNKESNQGLKSLSNLRKGWDKGTFSNKSIAEMALSMASLRGSAVKLGLALAGITALDFGVDVLNDLEGFKKGFEGAFDKNNIGEIQTSLIGLKDSVINLGDSLANLFTTTSKEGEGWGKITAQTLNLVTGAVKILTGGLHLFSDAMATVSDNTSWAMGNLSSEQLNENNKNRSMDFYKTYMPETYNKLRNKEYETGKGLYYTKPTGVTLAQQKVQLEQNIKVEDNRVIIEDKTNNKTMSIPIGTQNMSKWQLNTGNQSK